MSAFTTKPKQLTPSQFRRALLLPLPSLSTLPSLVVSLFSLTELSFTFPFFALDLSPAGQLAAFGTGDNQHKPLAVAVVGDSAYTLQSSFAGAGGGQWCL